MNQNKPGISAREQQILEQARKAGILKKRPDDDAKARRALEQAQRNPPGPQTAEPTNVDAPAMYHSLVLDVVPAGTGLRQSSPALIRGDSPDAGGYSPHSGPTDGGKNE